MADDEKLKKEMENMKKMIRAVLMPEKNGLTVRSFMGAYKGLMGSYIPFKKYGFDSIEAFLGSMPDAVRVRKDHASGDYMISAVATQETAHISRMVSAQKSNKKKVKKAPARSFRPSFSRPPSHTLYKPSSFKKPFSSSSGAFGKPSSAHTKSYSNAYGASSKSSFSSVAPPKVYGGKSYARPDSGFGSNPIGSQDFRGGSTSVYRHTPSPPLPSSSNDSRPSSQTRPGSVTPKCSWGEPGSKADEPKPDTAYSGFSKRPSKWVDEPNMDDVFVPLKAHQDEEMKPNLKITSKKSSRVVQFDEEPANTDLRNGHYNGHDNRFESKSKRSPPSKEKESRFSHDPTRFGRQFEIPPRFKNKIQEHLVKNDQPTRARSPLLPTPIAPPPDTTAPPAESSYRPTPSSYRPSPSTYKPSQPEKNNNSFSMYDSPSKSPVKSAVSKVTKQTTSRSSKPVPQKLTDNFKQKLDEYCSKKKFPTPIYDTSETGKGATRGYVSSTKIDSHNYGSLGVFSTANRAEMFAAKTACEALCVDEFLAAEDVPKLKIEEVLDTDQLKNQIRDLVADRINGLWVKRLPIEYKEKYNEELPDDIEDYLPKWDDVVTVETVRGTSRKILYPPKASPRPEIPKNLKPNIPPPLNTLHKGYFSTIMDCADFYVQLLESQVEQVQKCMTDIYEHCKLGHQTNVTADSAYCAAKYEGIWYRASILVDNKKSLDVNYVDFGNSQSVPREDTKALHLSLFEEPIQAVNCKLANVYQRNPDSWDRAAADLENIMDAGEEITIEVLEVVDNVCSVNLYSGTSSKSVNLQLIEKGLVGNCLRPKPSHPGPLEMPDTNAEWNITVSDIRDCTTKVVVRLLGEAYSDKLTTLEETIGLLNSSPPTAFFPEVGDICATRLEVEAGGITDENPWVRVRVDEIFEEKKEAKVLYLDYGDIDNIKFDKLVLLTATENRLPYQAFEVSLHGLENVTDPDTIAILSDRILGQSFIAEIAGCDADEKYSVVLYDTEHTDSEVNINESILKLTRMTDLEPQLPAEGEMATCYMSHISPDGVVYLHMEGSGFQRLQQMEEDAAETLRTAGASAFVRKPNRGKLVMALYTVPEEGAEPQWYRAMIKQILPNREVEVLFVDYGNIEVVSFDNLRDIDKASSVFHRLPYQAVEAVIDGLPPQDLPWTEKAIRQLQYIAATDCDFQVEVIACKTDDKPMVVDLWMPAEGEDEDETIELVSLRDIMIDNKHLFTDESEPSTPRSEMSDSHSGAQSPVHPVAVENIPLPDDSPLSSLAPENCPLPDDSPLSTPPVSTRPDIPTKGSQIIKSWVPGDEEVGAGDASPRVDVDRFGLKIIPNVAAPKGGDTVSVTHVNNPWDFKLIPVNLRPQLVKMQRQMSSYYISNGVAVTSDDLIEGDILACSHDDVWHRVVVKMNYGDGFVAVYFADQGDFTPIKVDSLRVLPDHFRSLPFLAISAKLTGVTPMDSKKFVWDTLSEVKYFTELVFTKNLEVIYSLMDDSGAFLHVTLANPKNAEPMVHRALKNAVQAHFAHY